MIWQRLLQPTGRFRRRSLSLVVDLTTMRELNHPPEIAGDEKATEMVRVWLAHNQLHVSMLLGMWQDAEECEVDERDAWGELLADLTKHIANGMMKEYGWDYDSTRDRIRAAFLKNFDDKSRTIEGDFPE